MVQHLAGNISACTPVLAVNMSLGSHAHRVGLGVTHPA